MYDLKGRFTFEGADEAISDLEKISGACGDVEEMAREAGAGFDEMGDDIAQGASRANTALSDLEKTAGAAAAQLGQARAVIGAMGMAGLGLLLAASKQAMDLEDATTRLKVVVGEDWPVLNRAIMEEQSRIRSIISEGEMIEALIPLARMLPQDSELLLEFLGPVNEAMIVAGVSAEKYSMVWANISRAIASGNAEMLATGSRSMPALFTTPEAVAMLRTMNKEYGTLKNAQILAAAFALQERIEQEKLNAMYDTGTSRLQSYSKTVGNFMEEFGKGFASVRATWTEVARGIFQFLIDENLAAPLGRFVTVASAMAVAIGGPAVFRTIVSRLLPGMVPQGLAGAAMLGKMALGLGAVALAVEDLWAALQGKESVVGGVFKFFGIEPEELAGIPEWAKQLALVGASMIGWQIAKAFAAHPGFFFTKFIPGMASVVGVMIGLEPLWSMIPGTEGLSEVVSMIPDVLREFMTTAGFIYIGATLGGLPGAAIGLTLSVILNVVYTLQKGPRPDTEAESSAREAVEEVRQEAQRIIGEDFAGELGAGVVESWSEALERSYTSTPKGQWGAGDATYTAFRDAVSGLYSALGSQLGPKEAGVAMEKFFVDVVTGIADDAARQAVAAQILQTWALSSETQDKLRRAADRTPPGEPTPGFEEYEPQGEAPVGGVTVNVNIGTGAVQVTGTASVDEGTRDEIIQRAVEAVAEGMRAVLDESPRGV